MWFVRCRHFKTLLRSINNQVFSEQLLGLRLEQSNPFAPAENLRGSTHTVGMPKKPIHSRKQPNFAQPIYKHKRGTHFVTGTRVG